MFGHLVEWMTLAYEWSFVVLTVSIATAVPGLRALFMQAQDALCGGHDKSSQQQSCEFARLLVTALRMLIRWMQVTALLTVPCTFPLFIQPPLVQAPDGQWQPSGTAVLGSVSLAALVALVVLVFVFRGYLVRLRREPFLEHDEESPTQRDIRYSPVRACLGGCVGVVKQLLG